MKGILLLNGEPYNGKIDTDGALTYCCDGAYKWACGRIKIDKNIGDFDSLSVIPDPMPDEVYPSEKNYTDGEIALIELLDRGVDEIEIYGAGGGRADHFLGNLHLMYRAHKSGVKCKTILNDGVVLIGEGEIKLNGVKGKTVSVLPFGGDLHIMSSKGLKYEYPPVLHYGECRGISNVVLSLNAELYVKGIALIFINL